MEVFGPLLLVLGPLLGSACYILGPLASVAMALARLKPWWLSPLSGVIAIPLFTLLFTPVIAFKDTDLPMPLPWLLASFIDNRTATSQSLLDNGSRLALIYGVAVTLVLCIRVAEPDFPRFKRKKEGGN